MSRRILITGASVAGNTVAWWVGRSAYVATATKVERQATAIAVPSASWLGFATLLAEGIWRDNPRDGR